MSFDWNEYFLLAKELSGDQTFKGNKEAKMRSAISRAYYAVIIQARTKICQLNSISFPKGNTHKWTIDKYTAGQRPLAQSIGTRLKRLKKRRERADYEDYVKNLISELNSALIEAERLMIDIDRLT